ncbi:MAG: TonB-dependent receptor [Candidatus Cloacimonetes bacterium]|nr:TonB-dependent receptor [Candidatus Cloacimonadota bacterium]
MKKGFVITVLFLLLILPAFVFAQTGTIAGKVTIEKTGDPLPNTAVFLSDAKTGTYTKKDGSFILKNVEVGIQQLTVSFVGYKKQTKEVTVSADETVVINFSMVVEAIKLGGISVNENRAIKRETPIAFTNVSQEQISGKYTTDDMPQLLEGVPGLFSTTSGLGEGELKIRGFDADKVQIMINGIPVNDPESQQVYWSNWTGLSSAVKSVQVQRGAGSSMYGSGAFGGSVNIETIGAGANPEKMWTFRSSVGGYSSEDDVADGRGYFVDYKPYNYNFLLKYNSGNLYGGKFNYSTMLERKVGNSYQIGTDYDGWSFGVEVQNLWGDHKVNTSLIVAPQEHRQARTSTDMRLQEVLGRNYNRNNNPEQLNYYNKPQLSIRDEWQITDNTLLMTNLFFTRGDGGGKYLNNDGFDVNTGRIMYKPVSEYNDNKYFGRHAYHVALQEGIELDGIEIFWNENDPTMIDSVYFNGSLITYGANLPNRDYNHTWINDSQNNHKQFGFNTYLDHKINDVFKVVVGGEMRYWRGVHRAESFDFQYYGGVYDQAQDRYNYHGIVTNISGFARLNIRPTPAVNILLDGQYANYISKVEEQPIQIFDYQLGKFTDHWYYATKTLKDEDGNLIFEEDDYEKTFSFFSPKVGANFNITEYLNLLLNYSIAYKEPKVTDWYSRSGGPDDYQTWYDDDGDKHVEKIDPEKATTIEFGFGYEGVGWNFGANYYRTVYEDKLESTYNQEGEYVTINAGKALHHGVELEAGLLMNQFDAGMSVTYSRNRWDDLDVDELFGEPSEEIEGCVVPYSPEKMANVSLGYTFVNMPMAGSLRIGFTGNFWNEYYGNYTSLYDEYKGIDPLTGEGIWEYDVDAKLPYYLTISSDITYTFKVGGKNASLRLDLKNINNREDNYSKAYWTADYGRNDALNSQRYMYVTPAPLFHAFLTAEINF